MQRKTITISILLAMIFMLFARCQNKNERPSAATRSVETANDFDNGDNESIYERFEGLAEHLDNYFGDADRPEMKEVGGVVYSKDLSTLIYCPPSREGGLEMPESVTTIANFAFEGSSISSITLSPRLKEIGDRAFTYCPNLQTINLPKRVDYDFLLDHFFNNFLRQIQYIHVHPGNKELSDINGVLFNKDQTTLLLYPNGRSDDYRVPSSVKTIGRSAFQNSLVASVVLPQGLTTIQDNAFADSPISSIVLPSSVEEIGVGAFNTCYSLTSITLPQRYVYDENTSGQFVYSAIEAIYVDNNNPYLTSMDGVLFTKDGETLVCYPSRLTDPYTVPDGVKRVDSFAFFNAQSPSVVLAESVEYAGDYCFFESAIESITLPEGELHMGKEVLGVCEYLQTIRIKSVTPPTAVDQETGISEERKEDITLYIPAGAKTVHQNDKAWGGFESYVEE